MIAQLALGGNVAVEGRARNTSQFLAEFADLDVPVFHSDLREANLCFGQPEFPAAIAVVVPIVAP